MASLPTPPEGLHWRITETDDDNTLGLRLERPACESTALTPFPGNTHPLNVGYEVVNIDEGEEAIVDAACRMLRRYEMRTRLVGTYRGDQLELKESS